MRRIRVKEYDAKEEEEEYDAKEEEERENGGKKCRIRGWRIAGQRGK